MTIYVNFDVETTGTVPGLHSMISFGAIAHRDPDFMCAGHFEVHIQELDDAGWDPDTRKWWHAPEQSKAAGYVFDPDHQRYTAASAMSMICEWLKDLLNGDGDCVADGPIVFVAYPANFDMSFLNYYMQRFAPDEWKELTFNKNVGWSCMDILTMSAMILDKPYLEATRRAWPEEWSTENPLQHTALEDARSQSFTFVRMMQTMRGLHRLLNVGTGPDLLETDMPGITQMGTDYTGDEDPNEPDGVDLGPTTPAEDSCRGCGHPFTQASIDGGRCLTCGSMIS